MARRRVYKYVTLWSMGGLLYILMEVAWRGRSHWTMFALGGLCFIGLGLINEVLPWDMPLWQQVVIGAGIITVLEFLTGCVVNLWLGWGVWDYSNKPGNILGQICPQFFLLWLPVSLAGIVLDDWLRSVSYTHLPIVSWRNTVLRRSSPVGITTMWNQARGPMLITMKRCSVRPRRTKSPSGSSHRMISRMI